MLFLAYKYGHSVEDCILANANAGGENVARGALLGALVGAAHGMEGFPKWSVEGLHRKSEIDMEIKGLLKENVKVEL